jgi:hypothetical protein
MRRLVWTPDPLLIAVAILMLGAPLMPERELVTFVAC